MEELKAMLRDVPDSYEDFVNGMMNYASCNEERKQRLEKFLKDHPGIDSSSVIGYVSDLPDFYDDAFEDKEALAVTA